MPQIKNHIAAFLWIALLAMLFMPAKAQVQHLPDGHSQLTTHAPAALTAAQPGVQCQAVGLSGTTSLYTVSIKVTGDKGYAVHEGDTILTGATKEYKVGDGASFTVDAFPDEGYRVDQLRWQVGSHNTSIDEFMDRTTMPHSATCEAIKEDVAFEVRFEQIPEPRPYYSVVLYIHEKHGYMTFKDQIIRDHILIDSLAEGDTGHVTVYPDPGYRIGRLRYEHYGFLATSNYYYDEASTPHSLDWIQYKRNVWIEPFFEPIPAVRPSYKVKVTSHPHGYTKVRGDMLRDTVKTYDVLEGDSLFFTAYPDDDHRVNEFKTERLGSGVVDHYSYTDQVTVPRTLTFYPAKMDATADVYFEKLPGTLRTYTVTVNSRGSGTTVASGITVRDTTLEVSAEEESMFQFRMTPDRGHRVARYIIQMANGNPEVTTFADRTAAQHQGTIADLGSDATLTVVYEPIPTHTSPYLAIQQGTEGSVDVQVSQNGLSQVAARPDEGWQLHAASLNGTDITAQLADSAAYALPDLTDNALLFIVYEQTPDGILQPEAQAVRVMAQKGGVTVTGVPTGAGVTVYTIDGRRVKHLAAPAGYATIALPPGVYLLRVAGRTFKFNIR